MKKLATLFTDSYREFRHVRTVTTAAMFGAVAVVLGYFTIQIGDYIKIGFSGMPNQLVCHLFGPVVGSIFGGAMDIVKYLIKPTGGFFPGLTLVPMAAGVIYGCFYYKKPVRLWRVFAAEFLVAVICNMGMTTMCLSVLYGKGFMALLPMRVFKNVIMWPINSLLFYSIARTLEASGVFRVLKSAERLGTPASSASPAKNAVKNAVKK